MKPMVVVLFSGLVLAGCAGKKEFAPEANASGAEIFQAACAECHEPKEHGKYFELSREKATAGAIADKIAKGGFFMPSFPNITGKSLEAVSEFVLSNSKVE